MKSVVYIPKETECPSKPSYKYSCLPASFLVLSGCLRSNTNIEFFSQWSRMKIKKDQHYGTAISKQYFVGKHISFIIPIDTAPRKGMISGIQLLCQIWIPLISVFLQITSIDFTRKQPSLTYTYLEVNENWLFRTRTPKNS